MAILGHSTIKLTVDTYGYVALDAQREAMRKLNEQLDG